MDINKLRIRALGALIGDQKTKDFAEKHNLDASYISQLLNGHRPMGEKAARNLEAKIGLAPNSLVMPTQFPDVHRAQGKDLPVSNLEEEALPVLKGSVPVVGKAKLGVDGYFEALDYPVGHGDGSVLISSTDPNAYALQVVGHSMHPRIKHKEYVMIEPNRSFAPGDEVLVKTVDGRAMIKEYSYRREGTWRFDSVNPNESPVFLEDDEIVYVHFVGAIVKSSRFIPSA
ncbi:S24 family peptidase [Pseudomonas aeruginosa]|nr:MULTISPECIES: S24 family peptidase [Pseudomonas]AON05432.1 hypothetical protein AM599_05715 [Pseudomonas aeruginosa]AON11421.1 hypothetical protein A6681_05715 [Pseudomonas aeruginosa]AON17409.1 hypothetical protein A7331_05710 [Pseudomonas aeruginosa]AON23932.1 hypothetical protein A6688_08435 [Pseudomonas aeruginosa]AON29404.1 hypothetical protein A6695_05715 [Pseudomonas aeruginosa]